MILKRLKKLWELSKVDEPIERPEKEPQPEIPREIFVPRVARDPVKAITEENNEHTSIRE